MLKVMRDSFQHLKWVLLAVVAAFIFGFVFIDMGLGGATRGDVEDRPYAARVNGETISSQDYNRALYFAEENYKRMYGGQFTPEMAQAMGLSKQVLDSLIEQRLLLQEAERLNLTAKPEEVRKRILTLPALNPDGRFVGQELYERFVTVQLGYPTASDFERDLAEQITLEKIESALANAIVVSPKAADAEYRRTAENAKIRYLLYPAAKAAAAVTVSPADVEAYYRAHQDEYAHGEQRELRYLVADLAKIRAQVAPTEQELRSRYEAMRQTDFKQPEAARVLHILIKSDAKATPEQDGAARAKASDLVQQLRGGADFGKLAREHSQDPSSAGNGGDMGFVDRGATVDVFDQAIFTLPLNQISDPIKSTEYGYHIVKVLERRAGGYRTFEEVRDQLSAQLMSQRAQDRAREEMLRIAARMREKKPATVDEFASYANDKVTSNTTQWFAKGEQLPGLGFNQQLLSWIFAAKPGDVTPEPVGTQRGPIVAYLAGVRPAGVSALAEIRARVENDARIEKARQVAQRELAAAVAGASTVDAVAAKLGLTPAETTINRQGMTSGIPGDTSALIEAVMASRAGEVKGPLVAGDSAVVFQTLEIRKADAAELAKNRAQYVDVVRQREARNLRTSLLQRLRSAAKVEINERVIEPQAEQQTS